MAEESGRRHVNKEAFMVNIASSEMSGAFWDELFCSFSAAKWKETSTVKSCNNIETGVEESKLP